MYFSALTQMLPYIRDGRLRGLAVTSASRSPLAPEIPTMLESGFDRFVTASINFIVAPLDTPISFRSRISEAVAVVLADDHIKQSFARMGAQARPAVPEELAVYLTKQQLLWDGIVKAAQISLD